MDMWGGGTVESLFTTENWDKISEEAGTKGIDYAAINIAVQVDPLIEKFGYEEAAQVAKGTANIFGLREEEAPQRDWLEVERIILERQIANRRRNDRRFSLQRRAVRA